MSLRHAFGFRNLQDLRFRLAFDEAENSRERNAHDHTGLLYEGAHPAIKAAALTGFTSPDLSRTFGTDTSHWDGNVNEKLSRGAGVAFTIIKAMDGTVETRYFRANRARAKDAGLIQGPYAWLYPNSRISCRLQAQALFDLLSSLGFDELLPSIDWEWTSYAGLPANPNMDDLEMWTDEWLRLAGRKPILYTAAGYARQFGTMPARLINKFAGLWIANYGVIAPAMPAGWLQWELHQFTASGESAIYAPNDAGKLEVDLNYVFDSLTLQRLTGGLVPPGGGTMTQVIQGEAIGNVTRRRSPAGETFSPARYLVTGDRIEADRNQYQWLHLTKINGVALTEEEWASAGTTQQYIKWNWVEVPTEPPPDPEPAPTYPPVVELHYADGVIKRYVPE